MMGALTKIALYRRQPHVAWMLPTVVDDKINPGFSTLHIDSPNF